MKDIKVSATVNIYMMLLRALPHSRPEPGDTGIWSNEDVILCPSAKAANIIADMLDAIGFDAVTGYYDPDEDAGDGEVDDCTGYWYVDV